MTETYADPAGRYRLDSQIATGGMGVVWRATDTRLNRQVAVKVLKDEFAADDQFRSRFETEARHAASLHHANIAGVFDYDSAPEQGRAPYLVMELVDGEPLSALLTRAKNDGQTLDPDVVRDLLAQASDGLAAAHVSGIVHRDVKPANLIVTPDGRVKVTDFGIARAADGVPITRTGAVMGTPQYLSPEQARGEQATPASDVYGLGVMAFECLTGQRPFEGDSPVATTLAHLQQPVPDLPPEVPADLAAVVQRAMAKEPTQRYPDAAAFAAALRDPAAAATAVLAATPPMVAGLPPATAYDGEAEPEEGKKRRVWLIVLIVLLLIAALLLLWWLLFGRDGEEDPEPASETTSERTPRTREPQTTEPETTQPETTAPPETTEPPETTAPAVIELNEADYVGRPVAEVESDLRGQGFNVTLSEVANDGSRTEDTVAGINPQGSVEEGSLITVDYYGPPPAPETTESSSPADETSPEGDDG